MTADGRAPAEIISSIQEQGRIVSEALKRLNALTTNPEARIRHSEVPRQVVDS